MCLHKITENNNGLYLLNTQLESGIIFDTLYMHWLNPKTMHEDAIIPIYQTRKQKHRDVK